MGYPLGLFSSSEGLSLPKETKAVWNSYVFERYNFFAVNNSRNQFIVPWPLHLTTVHSSKFLVSLIHARLCQQRKRQLASWVRPILKIMLACTTLIQLPISCSHFNQLSNDGIGRGHWNPRLVKSLPRNLLRQRGWASTSIEHTLF
jgi:hypothetical protein